MIIFQSGPAVFHMLLSVLVHEEVGWAEDSTLALQLIC